MSPILQQTSSQEQEPSPDDWRFEYAEVLDGGFNSSTDPALLSPHTLVQAINVQLSKNVLIKSIGFGNFPVVNEVPDYTYPPNLGHMRRLAEFPRSDGTVDNILVGDNTAAVWSRSFSNWVPMRKGNAGATVGTTVATAVSIVSTISIPVNSYACISLVGGRIQTVKVTANVAGGGNFTLTLHDPLELATANGAAIYLALALGGNSDAVVDVTTWPQQDRFYFTNGLDAPQEWDGHFVQRVQGLDPTTFTCKTLTAWGSYLLLGNTVEDAVYRPMRVRWCEPGAPATWNFSINYLDISFKADYIQKLLPLGPYIAVYKRTSISRLEFVDTSTKTFNPVQTIGTDGLVGTNAIAQVREFHIFMGDSNIYAYDGEFNLTPLGDDVRDLFVGADQSLPEESLFHCHAHYISTLDEFWLFVPWLVNVSIDEPFSDGTYFSDGTGFIPGAASYSVGTDTQYLLRFAFKYKAWVSRLFDTYIADVATYKSVQVTAWQDLDVSWDNLNVPWNSLSSDAQQTVLLLLDSTANQVVRSSPITGTDQGVPIPYQLVTHEFIVPNRKIRIDRADLVIAGYGVALDYSVDSGKTWKNWKVFNVGGDPAPVRVKKQFLANRVMFRLRGGEDFKFRSFGFRWKAETITGVA